LYGWTSLAAAYWAIAGAFLTGETAQLSPRAKRQLSAKLPRPNALYLAESGSGTGYVFAMLNLLAVMGFAGGAVFYAYVTSYEHLPKLPEWSTYNIASPVMFWAIWAWCGWLSSP